MTEQGKVLDINGLTTEEVKERQEKYGKNQLIPEKKRKFYFKNIKCIKRANVFASYCSFYYLFYIRRD